MHRRLNNLLRLWRNPFRTLPPLVTRNSEVAAERGQVEDSDRHGRSFELNYPDMTLGRLVDQASDRFGDSCAMAYAEARWSYRQLCDDVNRLAGGLSCLGVRPSDTVLLTLPNCPEYVISFLAIQKLGAMVVNAGPLMGVDDLLNVVAMTGPKLVIALDLQAGPLHKLESSKGGNGTSAARRRSLHWLWVSLKDYQTVWKRLGYQAKLRQSNHQNGKSRLSTRFHDLLSEAPPRPPTVLRCPDDIAVLQPTGGTTGKLKVAELSHRNLLANAMQLSVWARQTAGQDRVLGVLPMFHVYGLSTCLITTLFNASTILPVTRFRAIHLMEVIRRHRPTVLPLAPAIIEPLCDVLASARSSVLQEFKDIVESSIITSGAAPLTVPTARRFAELTGRRIFQGYGLTEASPVTHANPMEDPRDGSIGRPLPDTAVRVVDLNDESRDAAAGEPGEMLVCGPQVMKGYHQCPDETELVLKTDQQNRRWLRTGDVVRVDEDGFYHVLDRRKEMINCGGLKVYPAKVERVLKMDPRVRDVAVIGRPDPVKTETVVAVIVLTQESDPSHEFVDELRFRCREHLAPYELPQLFEFVEELPRTALGKLQKFRLRTEPDPSTDNRDSDSEHEDPDVADAGNAELTPKENA